MARPVCIAVRKDGEPCRAPAVPGGERCWVHDEAWADRAREGRALGAVKAGKLRSLEGKRKRLDTPRALAGFMSTLVHDALEGKVDADLARTIGYLVAVQTKVVEQARQSDVERMLAEVRALTADARRRA